jgi:uncharacterized iron-regulated membrane protein
MKPFRTVVFWMHLSAGVIAGLVILLMCVTGVALTYEKQVLEWADRRAWTPPPVRAGARPLPPETLLAKVTAARPAAPIALTMRADAAAAATVTLDGNTTLLVDPYTGAVIGEPPAALRAFFRTMTVWHRYLALEGASRAAGKAVTGAANLIFLFIVISGAFLWLPRAWSWTQFRNGLWFRAGLAPKARDFNWHNVIGVWSAVPLAIVVAGAVPISYPWASNLVYRLAGERPPAAAAAPPANAPPGERQRPTYFTTGLDGAWVAAERRVPAWRTVSTRLATSERAPIVLTVDEGDGGQPQKRLTLTIDRTTAAITTTETFANLSAGRRARSWLRFAHTGEFYGLAGQTVAGIVSAGGAVLVYTGIALACRRSAAAWRRRRRDPGADEATVRAA